MKQGDDDEEIESIGTDDDFKGIEEKPEAATNIGVSQNIKTVTNQIVV